MKPQSSVPQRSRRHCGYCGAKLPEKGRSDRVYCRTACRRYAYLVRKLARGEAPGPVVIAAQADMRPGGPAGAYEPSGPPDGSLGAGRAAGPPAAALQPPGAGPVLAVIPADHRGALAASLRLLASRGGRDLIRYSR